MPIALTKEQPYIYQLIRGSNAIAYIHMNRSHMWCIKSQLNRKRSVYFCQANCITGRLTLMGALIVKSRHLLFIMEDPVLVVLLRLVISDCHSSVSSRRLGRLSGSKHMMTRRKAFDTACSSILSKVMGSNVS